MSDEKDLGVPAEDSGRSTAPVGETPNVRLRPDAPAHEAVAARLGELVTTQNNLATSHPLFVVFQKRRIYGMDPQYAEPIVWYHSDGGEADEKEAAELEAAYQESFTEPEMWHRTGYVDVDVFCTACFTRKGCEDYLAVNGHNLNKPFIYVETLRRNEEMIGIRELLIGAFRARAEAEIPQPASGEELQPQTDGDEGADAPKSTHP